MTVMHIAPAGLAGLLGLTITVLDVLVAAGRRALAGPGRVATQGEGGA